MAKMVKAFLLKHICEMEIGEGGWAHVNALAVDDSDTAWLKPNAVFCLSHTAIPEPRISVRREEVGYRVSLPVTFPGHMAGYQWPREIASSEASMSLLPIAEIVAPGLGELLDYCDSEEISGEKGIGLGRRYNDRRAMREAKKLT